VIKIHSWSCK